MKEMKNMHAHITAYPEGDLWVVECSLHGFVSVATDEDVDSVLHAHTTAAHGAEITA